MPNVRIALENLDKTGDEELATQARIALGDLDKQDVDVETLDSEVIVLLDISMSMDDEFADGQVDAMLKRALAFASVVDHDQKVQVVTFGRRAHYNPKAPIDLTNYQGWLGRNWPTLENATYLGAGMARSMEVVAEQLGTPAISRLVGAKRRQLRPVASSKTAIVLTITDGQPHDPDKAKEVQFNSSYSPTFWSYLYVSNQPGGESFLRDEMDNMGGRYVDNSNAAFFPDIASITPGEFSSKVTKDFGEWSRFVRNRRNGLYLAA